MAVSVGEWRDVLVQVRQVSSAIYHYEVLKMYDTAAARADVDSAWLQKCKARRRQRLRTMRTLSLENKFAALKQCKREWAQRLVEVMATFDDITDMEMMYAQCFFL